MSASPTGSAAPLPSRPSLALLSNLAKALRKACAQGDPVALDRVRRHHPRFARVADGFIEKLELTLRDAQLVISREHGFAGWAELKSQVLTAQERAAADELIDAARRGDAEAITKVLDAHPDVIGALGGPGERTALHFAAEGGHRAVVDLLLQRGADPTVRDVGDNATALHFAAERGSLKIVKLLVEHGADVDGFGDVHGWDVLGWATLHHHVFTDVAEFLLGRGAKHNIFTAVAMGDLDAIRTLAANSRDVLDKPMAIWESRRRPLHLAVLKRQPKAAAVLLELGADVEATDVDDLTPLDFAALRGEAEIVDSLLARGALVHLPAAFGLRRADLVDRYLRDEPTCLRPGGRWARLIHVAAAWAPGDVIESLLDRGAAVDLRDDGRAFGTKRYTPLHEAAWHDNVDAMRVLIARGASLDARDETYDGTPLGWAKYAGKAKAVALLTSVGAPA